MCLPLPSFAVLRSFMSYAKWLISFSLQYTSLHSTSQLFFSLFLSLLPLPSFTSRFSESPSLDHSIISSPSFPFFLSATISLLHPLLLLRIPSFWPSWWAWGSHPMGAEEECRPPGPLILTLLWTGTTAAKHACIKAIERVCVDTVLSVYGWIEWLYMLSAHDLYELMMTESVPFLSGRVLFFVICSNSWHMLLPEARMLHPSLPPTLSPTCIFWDLFGAVIQCYTMQCDVIWCNMM